MSDQQTAATKQITFEGGYDELKGIVTRLGSDDVSVHEMFEGFRRGKGLEQALRGYLQEREGELTEIEQGHNLPQFDIVAPDRVGAESAGPSDTGDSQPAPGGSDDDIPF